MDPAPTSPRPAPAFPSIDQLERAAFGGWPAERVTDMAGWRLRYMREVTRRGNSVWPVDQGTADPQELTERIQRVEAYYASLGSSRVLFQLSPLCSPALEPLLEARGYSVEAPVSLQVAALDNVAKSTPRGNVCVELTPGASFVDLNVRRGRYMGQAREFSGLLSRLQGRTGYASVELNDEPVASGMAVCDDELVGIFALATVPEARRRGAASILLGAVCRWAQRRGAHYAYLQVEADNVPATRFFARHGFREAYKYHYRARELKA